MQVAVTKICTDVDIDIFDGNAWNLTISCQYLRRWWRAKLLSQEIGTANQVYKGEAKKLVKDCIQQPTKVFYNNAKNLQIK